jgi:aspartate beta-hydroxylase
VSSNDRDDQVTLSVSIALTATLSQIPRHYHHAFFSAITSHTHIEPHYGPTNKKLRCQLPLIISDLNSCTLTAGGVTRSLEEGKCLIFDDSFLHEARNESTNPRIILIFDIWHPDLSDEEVVCSLF